LGIRGRKKWRRRRRRRRRRMMRIGGGGREEEENRKNLTTPAWGVGSKHANTNTDTPLA